MVSREGSGAPGEAEGAGKGLRLEQRRLWGDLVALHKPLTGGGSRGGRALLAGNRDRREGTASGWARAGSGWILGKISYPKGSSGPGTAAQGRGGVPIPGGI